MRCGGVWWVCDNCRVSYFYDTIVVGVSEIWRDLASEGKWWCDRRPGDDCTVQNAHVQYVVQLLYRPVRVPQLGYNQLLQTRNYFAIHPCHNLQSLYTFHDKQSVLLGEFLLFKIWAWIHRVCGCLLCSSCYEEYVLSTQLLEYFIPFSAALQSGNVLE